MRELEGLSYKDIGERMGMSRPAVESTLFRARKRLGEEYDELASGARCLRVQAIIADAGEARARRCATSASSRATSRTASRAGGSPRTPASTSRCPRARACAGKIAALLPLPAFLRLRRGGGGEVAATALAAAAAAAGWRTCRCSRTR